MMNSQDTQDFRLTDELERQLIQRAIDEQFRPHPMRALAELARKVAGLFKSVEGKTGGRTAQAA